VEKKALGRNLWVNKRRVHGNRSDVVASLPRFSLLKGRACRKRRMGSSALKHNGKKKGESYRESREKKGKI